MGSAKSGGKIQVSDYNLSQHLGICLYTPGLTLLALWFGDKLAWRGQLTNTTTVVLDNPNLFGGEKKEGGIRGLMTWLPGASSQLLSDFLAARFGRTGATCPGFRGFASLFLTGANPTPSGFYVGSNNPYLKAPSVRVRRPSIGLNPTYALINLPNDSKGNAQKASNPAHMLYECLVDTDFGMSADPTTIDKNSYEAAAVTLFNEGFGLAMLWRRQSKIEDFIGEIVDHIQAVQYTDPITGLWTIKLLRDDYDPNTVPVMTVDNANLSNFRRKLWGEIANEVVVTWTNPETEKEETVSSQDLAAISRQGGTISSSKNYYGVRSQALAMTLAQRDLAAMVHPFAAADAEVDRSQWQLTPGSVVKLVWPEHGINGVFMRAMSVGRGSPRSRKIQLALQEDIFALGRSSYGTPVQSQWSNPSQVPVPLTTYRLGTAPAFLTVPALGLVDASKIIYPAAVASIVATRPNDDYYAYELYSTETLPTGAVVPVSLGDRPIPGGGDLAVPLVQEATTTIASFANFIGPTPGPGSFLLIGNAADSVSEIALVQSGTDSNWVVSRGVLDTTPKAWPAGTNVWVISGTIGISDVTERSSGEVVPYRLLPKTSLGTLPYASASDLFVTISDRPHMPLRPADVKINGVGFGNINAAGITDFVVTWANRNRVTEATQALRWDEPTVSPEAGQTATLEILDASNAVVWSAVGVTGTTYTIHKTDFGSLTAAKVRVSSVRSGFTSLQSHVLPIINL